MSFDAIVFLTLPETGLYTPQNVRFLVGTEWHCRKIERALCRLARLGYISRSGDRFGHLRKPVAPHTLGVRKPPRQESPQVACWKHPAGFAGSLPAPILESHPC